MLPLLAASKPSGLDPPSNQIRKTSHAEAIKAADDKHYRNLFIKALWNWL